MTDQVNSISRAAYFEIYKISKIRNVLSREACKLLMVSNVMSKLDYGNAMLLGITEYNLYKMQKVQNRAARLIFNLPRSSHVHHLLFELHWLPVRYRILFKVVLIIYKCINLGEPVYLNNSLNTYSPSRQLRSSTSNNLEVPRILSSWGERSFSFTAVKYFNNLPDWIKLAESITIFKSRLKQHLFNLAFIDCI